MIKNVVHQVDCNEFMRNIPTNHYDLAIVDPPYFDGPQNKNYFGNLASGSNVKRLCKNSKHWQLATEKYYEELLRISNKYIFWGCNYYPKFPFHTGRIIWDKVNGKTDFSDCEIAATNIFDHVRQFAYMWSGMLQGLSITAGRIHQGNKRKNEKRIHPTQKPVILYKWILQNYAKPGQTIFDSHVGSGSIRIACHDMGYDFEGCELDPDYWTAQEARYKNHASQQTLFTPEEIYQEANHAL